MIEAGGRPVAFVARPGLAPENELISYCRPDDIAEDGATWRERVWEYNRIPSANPLRLCRAFELYEPTIYRSLVEHLGVQHVYILSAGWGLIESSFLTPYYDITFSQSADLFKKRRRDDEDFKDFNMLPANTNEEVFFFGGRDYLQLFAKLTQGVPAKRTAFYNSETPQAIPGCEMRRFETRAKTNWHYLCARQFLEGARF